MLALPTPHGRVTLRLPDDPAKARRITIAARRCLLCGKTDARLPLPAGTPFQQACWRAALRIPCGQTRTYAWVAQQAGSPAAARAAAQAMRRNPWPLAIPCHRVVGTRDLGGYAGSRNPRSSRLMLKKWLLARESNA